VEGVVRRLRRRVTGKNADIVPTLVFSSDFWRMARSHKVQRVIRWVDGGGRGGGEWPMKYVLFQMGSNMFTSFCRVDIGITPLTMKADT
jgi:hypothetical protein